VKDTRDIELIIDEKGKCPIVSQVANNGQTCKEVVAPWRRPATGWAKLNFDGSFLEAEGIGAWGAVAWGRIPYCPNAAEAIAGLEVIKVIIPHYAGLVHLENDCASLISELCAIGPNKSSIADIVKDMKSLIRSFSDSLISKVNRASNQVAHEMARLVKVEANRHVLIGAVPPCVVEMAKCECKASDVS
jgi:hypothetical protein